jgi:hypothetical protein
MMQPAERPERSRKWWIAIWRDTQFWVPLIVLIVGILLLRFVQ